MEWKKDGNQVLVGRNMDWTDDLRSNLWVFPRGIKRDGLAANHFLTWTAKYGSVGVSGYDVGTRDGMNEKGFSGNMLWLAESEFGKRDEGRPGLCVSQWLQFCLDNFATVEEAVAYFQAHDVYNDGTVLVKDSTFTSNYAFNDGGGIYNENMLKVIGSTFTGNYATVDGGGIFNDSGGMVTVRKNSFADNSAAEGGGIYNLGTLINTKNVFLDNTGGDIYS